MCDGGGTRDCPPTVNGWRQRRSWQRRPAQRSSRLSAQRCLSQAHCGSPSPGPSRRRAHAHAGSRSSMIRSTDVCISEYLCHSVGRSHAVRSASFALMIFWYSVVSESSTTNGPPVANPVRAPARACAHAPCLVIDRMHRGATHRRQHQDGGQHGVARMDGVVFAACLATVPHFPSHRRKMHGQNRAHRGQCAVCARASQRWPRQAQIRAASLTETSPVWP